MNSNYLFLTILGLLNYSISGAQQQETSLLREHNPPAFIIARSNDISRPEAPFKLPRQEKITAYRENQKIVEGATHNHRLQGSWQSWYFNGVKLDSGVLKNGIPEGEWKHWHVNGRLLAIRNYDADKTERIKNEMRRKHPKQIAYPLTELYLQDRAAALRFLSADYSFSPAKRRSGNLSPVEFVEINHDPAQGYEPPFETCLHHGLWMNFFESGELKDSGYYNNGLPEGIWLHRSTAGGSYWTGAYKNARRWKEWKKFSGSGKLLLIVFYNPRGEREWSKEINSSTE